MGSSQSSFRSFIHTLLYSCSQQGPHLHVWHRDVSYGNNIVLLLNISPDTSATFTGTLAQVGVTIYPAYDVRDVINDVGYGQVYVTDHMNVTVGPSSVVMLKCSAQH